MEGKSREGLREETPRPFPRWSFCECLQWACRLRPCPWGRGVTGLCVTLSHPGHHRPLGICRAAGHRHNVHVVPTSLTEDRGACVQVSEAPSWHSSREHHRPTSPFQQRGPCSPIASR